MHNKTRDSNLARWPPSGSTQPLISVCNLRVGRY
jgi:hypothetical protein